MEIVRCLDYYRQKTSKLLYRDRLLFWMLKKFIKIPICTNAEMSECFFPKNQQSIFREPIENSTTQTNVKKSDITKCRDV